MNIHEEKLPERPKRLLSLPPVTRETVLEILAELAIDRTNFTRQAVPIMMEENPFLAEAIILASPTKPEPDTALISAIALYECYSRTARESGKRLLLVSQDTIRTHGEEMIRMFPEGEASFQDEKTVEWAAKRIIEEQKKVIETAGRNNPNMVLLFEFFLKQSAIRQRQEKLLNYFVSLGLLFDMFIFLHAQEEVNELKGKFQ